MGNLWNEDEFSSRYAKRLAIVVPYRDRAEHLAAFIPHLTSYFQRDKLDRHISVSIHIIEQSGRAPFNRGKLLNCGYTLTREVADYFCFHDVDYLPIWADYSWTEKPARLIRYGLPLQEDWYNFFGGVVLFDKVAFERVNGYPNSYWGWGHEDTELGLRCKLAGFDHERRDGTYQPLSHPSAGFVAPGVYSEEARRTHMLFHERRPKIRALMETDGISTLKFVMINRVPVWANGSIVSNAFHYRVGIGNADSELSRQ